MKKTEQTESMENNNNSFIKVNLAEKMKKCQTFRKNIKPVFISSNFYSNFCKSRD